VQCHQPAIRESREHAEALGVEPLAGTGFEAEEPDAGFESPPTANQSTTLGEGE
jgi:hypothetical protein